MQKHFTKIYYEEKDMWFYNHFQVQVAVQQIVIAPEGKFYMIAEHPFQGEHMLYDQSLDDLELQDSEFISEEVFYSVWKNRAIDDE